MTHREKTSVGDLDDLAASFGKAHDDYGRFAHMDDLDTAYTAGLDAVHNADAAKVETPKAAAQPKIVDTTGYGHGAVMRQG